MIAVTATREAASLVRAKPGLAATIGLIAAAGIVSVMLSVGSLSASLLSVQEALEHPDQRVFVLTDEQADAGIDPTMAVLVGSATEAVEWMFAVGEVTDYTLNGLDVAVSGRVVQAMSGEGYTIVAGRTPTAGEVALPVDVAAKLNVSGPWGYITHPSGVSLPIVALVEPLASDTPVANVALVAARDDRHATSRIVVSVKSTGQIGHVAQIVRDAAMISPTSNLSLKRSDTAAATRLDVLGAVSTGRRQVAIIAIASVLVANVIAGFALVAVQRHRFGIKRVLGASRSDLSAIVLMYTLLCSSVGALIGVGAALGGAPFIGLAVPSASFAAAACASVVICAIVGSVIPAVVAGLQDPVTVLRTI